MERKTIILCIDGLDPAYLETAVTPTLNAIAARGFFKLVNAVVPSVTNVNNLSIVTGSFPETHGIAANYRYDPATGEGEYIETDAYLEAPTIFERARAAGLRSALLVTKDKLLRILRRGTTLAFSAEHPPAEWVALAGPAEPIYSGAIDHWQLRALKALVARDDPDLVYASTTDYIMHMHGPEEPEAIAHVETLDRLLGELLEQHPHHQLLITADHGMRWKEEALDLTAILDSHGLEAVFVPVIKDRYIVHHSNLGGVGYLYAPEDALGHIAAVLESTPGVEAVHPREEAAALFRLPADRIGDLFVLADARTVFSEPGLFPTPRHPVHLRTHGSAHEATVPLFALNASAPQDAYAYNLDVVRQLGIA